VHLVLLTKSSDYHHVAALKMMLKFNRTKIPMHINAFICSFWSKRRLMLNGLATWVIGEITKIGIKGFC
jgi:hypothetical protein